MNNEIKRKIKGYVYNENDEKKILDYITNLQTIEREYSAILSENAELENKITNLQEENEELKMTNLALADDITKNKIIKQEVLTECCGIPIGEIPMLKIQNDEYKQRIDKAIEYLEKNSEEVELNFVGFPDNIMSFKGSVQTLLNILQGEQNE